jgi:hypothetical protein
LYDPAPSPLIVEGNAATACDPEDVPDQKIVPDPEPDTVINPSVALHEFGSSGVKVITGRATTVIVPVVVAGGHPPVVVTV